MRVLGRRWARASGAVAGAVLAVLESGLAAAALGCGADPIEPAQVCSAAVTRRCWEPLGLEGRYVTTVAATPMGLFAGGFSDGVFRLDSASGAWVSLGLDHAIVSSLLYVPADAARLLVGVMPRSQEQTDAAIFATEDGGQTWRPWDGGLAQQYGRRLWAYSLAMDPGDPKVLFWGGDAEILRSRDGGATWEFVYGRATYLGGGVLSLLVSPRRDGNVWAGGQSAYGDGYVHHSRDWGDSWKFYSINVAAILALAVDPSAPGTLWAGASGGVMSSDDGGETWQVRFRGLDGFGGMVFLNDEFYVFGRVVSPDDSVHAKGRMAAFRSPNHAVTWETLPVPPNVAAATALGVDSRGRLVVGTNASGVWRYTPD